MSFAKRFLRQFSTSSFKRSDEVVVEKLEEFKVVSIGINRPEKRNCINKETAEKLFQAFYDFEHDESAHCAILHGLGGTFCAGYDLSELANLDKENMANEIVSLDRIFRPAASALRDT